MLNLRSINKNRFTLAKRLWTASNSLKLLMFFVGAASVLSPRPYPYVPQVLLALAITSEIVQWRSDVVKGNSEALLRKLDLCRSFQKDISEADKRDIVASLPRKLRKKFDEAEPLDTYFESDKLPGPTKAIENLIESAWYTRKLTESMVLICVALTAFLLLVSIYALIITSRELTDANTRETVSKVVTSWLLLIFTLSLAKNAWLYSKLSQRCQKVETAGEHLLKGELTEAEALKQWHEYQIARSSCPLLPDFLWKLRQVSLDDAWRQGKSRA